MTEHELRERVTALETRADERAKWLDREMEALHEETQDTAREIGQLREELRDALRLMHERAFSAGKQGGETYVAGASDSWRNDFREETRHLRYWKIVVIILVLVVGILADHVGISIPLPSFGP